MENHRSGFAIVFAGYDNEMHRLMSLNPGLRSRIGRTFEFESYDASQLHDIFVRQARGHGFAVPAATSDAVMAVFERAIAVQDRGFGNGRFARSVFEEAVQLHATRLARATSPSDDDYQTLQPDDIPHRTRSSDHDPT